MQLLLYFCVFLFCGISFANSKKGEKCRHAGVLNNVYLEGGFETNTHALIKNANTMAKCIKKCCKRTGCDLAMLKNKKCYSVNCKGAQSCQISHSKTKSSSAAQIAFIINHSAVGKKKTKKRRSKKRKIKKEKPIDIQQMVPVKNDYLSDEETDKDEEESRNMENLEEESELADTDTEPVNPITGYNYVENKTNLAALSAYPQQFNGLTSNVTRDLLEKQTANTLNLMNNINNNINQALLPPQAVSNIPLPVISPPLSPYHSLSSYNVQQPQNYYPALQSVNNTILASNITYNPNQFNSNNVSYVGNSINNAYQTAIANNSASPYNPTGGQRVASTPTKDNFVTEIQGEIDDGNSERDTTDIGTSADVGISEDGAIEAKDDPDNFSQTSNTSRVQQYPSNPNNYQQINSGEYANFVNKTRYSKFYSPTNNQYVTQIQNELVLPARNKNTTKSNPLKPTRNLFVDAIQQEISKETSQQHQQYTSHQENNLHENILYNEKVLTTVAPIEENYNKKAISYDEEKQRFNHDNSNPIGENYLFKPTRSPVTMIKKEFESAESTRTESANITALHVLKKAFNTFNKQVKSNKNLDLFISEAENDDDEDEGFNFAGVKTPAKLSGEKQLLTPHQEVEDDVSVSIYKQPYDAPAASAKLHKKGNEILSAVSKPIPLPIFYNITTGINYVPIVNPFLQKQQQQPQQQLNQQNNNITREKEQENAELLNKNKTIQSKTKKKLHKKKINLTWSVHEENAFNKLKSKYGRKTRNKNYKEENSSNEKEGSDIENGDREEKQRDEEDSFTDDEEHKSKVQISRNVTQNSTSSLPSPSSNISQSYYTQNPIANTQSSQQIPAPQYVQSGPPAPLPIPTQPPVPLVYPTIYLMPLDPNWAGAFQPTNNTNPSPDTLNTSSPRESNKTEPTYSNNSTPIPSYDGSQTQYNGVTEDLAVGDSIEQTSTIEEEESSSSGSGEYHYLNSEKNDNKPKKKSGLPYYITHAHSNFQPVRSYHHNYQRYARKKKLQPLKSHGTMINTGIKANTLLGKMLTGHAEENEVAMAQPVAPIAPFHLNSPVVSPVMVIPSPLTHPVNLPPQEVADFSKIRSRLPSMQMQAADTASDGMIINSVNHEYVANRLLKTMNGKQEILNALSEEPTIHTPDSPLESNFPVSQTNEMEPKIFGLNGNKPQVEDESHLLTADKQQASLDMAMSKPFDLLSSKTISNVDGKDQSVPAFDENVLRSIGLEKPNELKSPLELGQRNINVMSTGQMQEVQQTNEKKHSIIENKHIQFHNSQSNSNQRKSKIETNLLTASIIFEKSHEIGKKDKLLKPASITTSSNRKSLSPSKSISRAHSLFKYHPAAGSISNDSTDSHESSKSLLESLILKTNDSVRVDITPDPLQEKRYHSTSDEIEVKSIVNNTQFNNNPGVNENMNNNEQFGASYAQNLFMKRNMSRQLESKHLLQNNATNIDDNALNRNNSLPSSVNVSNNPNKNESSNIKNNSNYDNESLNNSISVKSQSNSNDVKSHDTSNDVKSHEKPNNVQSHSNSDGIKSHENVTFKVNNNVTKPNIEETKQAVNTTTIDEKVVKHIEVRPLKPSKFDHSLDKYTQLQLPNFENHLKSLEKDVAKHGNDVKAILQNSNGKKLHSTSPVNKTKVSPFFNALKEVLIKELHSENSDGESNDVSNNKLSKAFINKIDKLPKKKYKIRKPAQLNHYKSISLNRFDAVRPNRLTAPETIGMTHRRNNNLNMKKSSRKTKSKKHKHQRYKIHRSKVKKVKPETKPEIKPVANNNPPQDYNYQGHTFSEDSYNFDSVYNGDQGGMVYNQPINPQQDMMHGHPMNGHRYGDADYQASHKWANHNFSRQPGHYGLHDDKSDNHDDKEKEANAYSDKETDKTNPNATSFKQESKVYNLKHPDGTYENGVQTVQHQSTHFESNTPMVSNGLPFNYQQLSGMVFPLQHFTKQPITFGKRFHKIHRHNGLSTPKLNGLIPHKEILGATRITAPGTFTDVTVPGVYNEPYNNIKQDNKNHLPNFSPLSLHFEHVEPTFHHDDTKSLNFQHAKPLQKLNKLHDIPTLHDHVAVKANDRSPPVLKSKQVRLRRIDVNREQSINDKLSTFNHLANTLRSKLAIYHKAKSISPPNDAWQSFMTSQQRLGLIKEARQNIIDGTIPSCERGLTVRGATLRGGILSGEFKSMGVVATQKACTALCCRRKKCDIAMTIGRECINIRCFNKKACTIAPAGNLAVYRNILPVVTFVKRTNIQPPNQIEKRSLVPRNLDETLRELDEGELYDINQLVDNVNMIISSSNANNTNREDFIGTSSKETRQ